MRHTARLLALGVIIILLAAAVDGQERRTYAGRRVADVLRELQSAQVRIIFSSDLVPPTLTVKAEPKPASPREIAQQILASHGHLGTQFEVRLNDGGLRVSVREGTVALENARGRWVSNEGEALHVVPGRTIERRSIQTDGTEWSWVNDLAPAFVLEGSTLGAFLDWAARHLRIAVAVRRSRHARSRRADRSSRIDRGSVCRRSPRRRASHVRPDVPPRRKAGHRHRSPAFSAMTPYSASFMLPISVSRTPLYVR